MNESKVPEFSIVIESYTLAEGGDLDRFRRALRTALSMLATTTKRGEVMVVDVTDGHSLAALLKDEFPEIRRVSAAGLGYDAAKMELALQESCANYLLFLDGDCIAQSGWLENMLNELDSGTGAVGGYTLYDGGFFAKIMSVMDFGFFYPVSRRPLKCYASNNCAFSRATLLTQPVPRGNLRCNCYHHAQCLLRCDTPIYLIPSAKVLHEMQPVLRERTRQGYDIIAAGRGRFRIDGSSFAEVGSVSGASLVFAASSPRLAQDGSWAQKARALLLAGGTVNPPLCLVSLVGFRRHGLCIYRRLCERRLGRSRTLTPLCQCLPRISRF